MKGDFSRNTFDRERPYSSVRMQQGRVLVDADWNEQGDIHEFLRRAALRDVIGASGVPSAAEDSFEVFVEGGELAVRPGRIWVDGMLCEVDAITIDPAELPGPDANGTWLVYLEARQRHLTAIEDPSIREVALGGPDTCTRTETACRIRLEAVQADACEDIGDFTPEGNTTGQMAAWTEPPTDTGDPCVVPSQAGYTGLENHLYRIEIHQGGSTGGPGPAPTFKWSRDNGSVLSAWLGRSGRELTIESLGRDTVRGFHDVQWIELGDDTFDAADQPGPLVEVESSVPSEDGEGGVLTVVAGDEPQLFNPDPAQHPKVRRWDADAVAINPGTPQDLGEHHLQIRFTPGTYRAGDFWWIPARAFVGEFAGSIEWPNTAGVPDDVDAHGVERRIARLGLVRINPDQTEVVDDCRCIFPPLCHHDDDGGCCCTVTVGPSAEFRTIQAGILALPPEGGQVCIEDGIYRENVVLRESHITLRGCGSRTIWQSADTAMPALHFSPATDGISSVTVRDLTFQVPDSVAIQVDPGRDVAEIAFEHLVFEAQDRAAVIAPRIAGLRITDCRVSYTSADPDAPTFRREPAIYVGGARIHIADNEIVVADVLTTLPSTPLSFSNLRPSAAAGGMQIIGNSDDVEIRGNRIAGGSWNGITLGSVHRFRQVGSVNIGGWRLSEGGLQGPGVDDLNAHYQNLDLSLPMEAPIETTSDGSFLGRWLSDDNFGSLISDGDLRDIRILENRVQQTGGCALAAAHFFDIEGDLPDLIGIDGLVVRENLFDGCLRLPPSSTALNQADLPFAAVCLAGVGGRQQSQGRLALRGFRQPLVDNRFENNVVSNNGNTWLAEPVCGTWIQYGRGLCFRGNRIADNGAPANPDISPVEGRRGGAVFGMVTVDTFRVNPADDVDTLGQRQDGIPALVFHDNVVVSLQGRALDVLALGPVSITDNQFTARGPVLVEGGIGTPGVTGLNMARLSGIPMAGRQAVPARDFLDAMGGDAIRVINTGISNELYLQTFGFSGLGRAAQLLNPESRGEEIGLAFINGNVLFNDNQIVIDALGEGRTFTLSSILLMTMGHLTMEGNQADANMPFGEFMLTHALAFGFSAQITQNRFTEGLIGSLLSGITLGLMNNTSHNQGTHCFLGLGLPQVSRVAPNDVMAELFMPEICGRIAELQEAIGFPSRGTNDPTPTPGPAGGQLPKHPNADQIQELLNQEGPLLPAATDRIQVRGFDHIVDTYTLQETRSALAAAGSGDPETAEAFLDERENRRWLKTIVRDRETGVTGQEKGTVTVIGQVIAPRGELLPEDLLIVLSDRQGPDNGFIESDVDPEGFYSLSSSLDEFKAYFTRKKYLVVTALYQQKPFVSAEQLLGPLDQPVRRLNLRLKRSAPRNNPPKQQTPKQQLDKK